MSLFVCSKNSEHQCLGLTPKFCSECGAEVIHKECPGCQTLLTPDQNFCEKCGADVSQKTNEIMYLIPVNWYNPVSSKISNGRRVLWKSIGASSKSPSPRQA